MPHRRIKNWLFSRWKTAELQISSICTRKCCRIKNHQTSKLCCRFVIHQITQTQTETETEAVRSHMKLRNFWAMGRGSGRRPLDPPLLTESVYNITLSLADRGGGRDASRPNSFDFMHFLGEIG